MSTGGTVDIKPDEEVIQVKPDAGVLNADLQAPEPDGGTCGMYKSKWGAYDNYRCERCRFSDLRKDVAEQQQAICGLKQTTIDQGE